MAQFKLLRLSLGLPCVWLLGQLSWTAMAASLLREFTGVHTRVVWIQDAGQTACVFSERPTLRLMGLDSDDGQGERALLPDLARYWKPLLTDDGTRVMFGDLEKQTVEIVNWDGSGRRTVLENANFEDVWTDPQDGVEWFYAKVQERRGNETIGAIRRYRLAEPTVSELVWDKMPIHMFMVSGDGRAASGGGDGGNSPQGILTLPNGSFSQRAGGCWPSMAPDNSLRSWVFTGNHRSIHFGVTTDRTGKGYTYGVEFDKSPGLTITGRQELYHPRWSNDIRFLVATAPFSDWNYQAEAKIPNDVAAKVEIYLGKFAPDFKSVERWVQVTSNQRGDYWPDAWIKPPPGPPVWLSTRPAIEEAVATASEPDRTGQLFLWHTGADGNQLVDPTTGAIRQCLGQFRDAARYGRHHVMDLTGGAFVPEATAAPWLAAVQASGAFAIEAVLTPLAPPPAGEGVVLAFADELEGGNVVLSQRGDQLVLRWRDERVTAPLPLVRLPPGRASQVIVSYAPGKLAVFVDGQRVLLANSPTIPVSGWLAQPLIFGDSWRGGHDWPGLLEGVGLFAREMGAPEARQRWAAWQERQAGRPEAVERVVVEAKLVGTCPAADPLAIAPYKRCLSVQQFEIVKVVQGKLAEPVVSVAQWSVLDGRVVPEYLEFKAGQTYRLALEHWGDRPEQESERLISGDFEEVDLFYQVRETPPWKAAAVTAPEPAPAVWQPILGQTNRHRLVAPVHIQGQEKPSLFAAEAGVQLEAAGQEIVFEHGSLTEIANAGSLRLGGAGAGAVAAVVVVAGGSGFASVPTLSLSGGGGQGAAAEAIMAVTGLELVRLGADYAAAPTVAIAPPDVYGGRQATAVATINQGSGALANVRITDPGSGYLRIPQVTLEGGGGSQAEVRATLSLVAVWVTHGGNGYTTPPAATVNGDGHGVVLQPVLQRTLLRYVEGQGHALIRNTGTLDQDGAAILFDWAAPQNNTGNRGLENSGTWTMRNGALIQFGSSTGRPLWVGRFVNDGAFHVLDGARIGLQNLDNRGTLQLGAGAVLGHVDLGNGDGVLRNTGQVQVVGGTAQEPVVFGLPHPERTGKRTVDNGRPDGGAKARFTIGDGRGAAAFQVVGGEAVFANHPDAATLIQPGATLALITNDNGAQHLFNNRPAVFNNDGELTLAGVLRVQGNHGGFTGIGNRGRLTIQGEQAGLERLPSSAGPGAFYQAEATSSQLLNQAGGEVLGSGTFTYVNLTGNPAGGYLRLINLGTLAPGGDQPGQLTFANVNLQFGPPPAPTEGDQNAPAGCLRIRFAGPDRHSALRLLGDADGGHLDLGDGQAATLDLLTPAGVLPHGRFRIVTAKAVQGRFGKLQFNGQSPVPYSVDYLPDAIEVVFP